MHILFVYVIDLIIITNIVVALVITGWSSQVSYDEASAGVSTLSFLPSDSFLNRTDWYDVTSKSLPTTTNGSHVMDLQYVTHALN